MAQTSPVPDLTVAMICRDAAAGLGEAVESVRGLAGRILVLDTGSTDDSVERAREAGAEVLVHDGFAGFGPARAAALAACTTPWVFFLDTDERVDPRLAAAIRGAVTGPPGSTVGWRVRRQTRVLGHRMRSMGLDRDRPLRLVRRERATVSDTLVHEVVRVAGAVGELDGVLHHDTFRSLDHYLRKIDHYTTLELEQTPRPLRSWHLALVGPATFLKWWLLRGGWRDGVAGLVWAGLTATGRFVRDMKVWIAEQQKRPPASADDL